MGNAVLGLKEEGKFITGVTPEYPSTQTSP